jgi:hypothetical protein
LKTISAPWSEENFRRLKLLSEILIQEFGLSDLSVQEASFRLDRVIEKLATSDKVTLTVERLPEGKNARHVKRLGL